MCVVLSVYVEEKLVVLACYLTEIENLGERIADDATVAELGFPRLMFNCWGYMLFALVKGKLAIALMTVAIGAFGTCHELLQKPELAAHSDLLVIGAELCVLAVAVISILIATGRRQK